MLDLRDGVDAELLILASEAADIVREGRFALGPGKGIFFVIVVMVRWAIQCWTLLAEDRG